MYCPRPFDQQSERLAFRLYAKSHSLIVSARHVRPAAAAVARQSIPLRLANAGCLTYANGHPAGLLFGSSGRRLLTKGGPPAGLFAESRYEFEHLPLAAGDLGLLVTDGITEAIEEDGVPAADRLDASVCAMPEPRTPERVCDALMDLACCGAGPLGVSGCDNKTVLAFLVDSPKL